MGCNTAAKGGRTGNGKGNAKQHKGPEKNSNSGGKGTGKGGGKSKEMLSVVKLEKKMVTFQKMVLKALEGSAPKKGLWT